MKYQRVVEKNGSWTRVDRPRDFDDTPPTLAPNKGKWVPILVDVKPTPSATQLLRSEQEFTANHVKMVHTLVDKTAEQIAQDEEAAAQGATEAALATAIREFEEETNPYKASYSQVEIDSFHKQEAQAIAWTADNTAPTRMLDAIIAESGETKQALVTRILLKAGLLEDAIGAAIGKKQKKSKAV